MSKVMAKNKDNNAPCVNPMIINAKYNEFLDAKAMKKRLLQKKKKNICQHKGARKFKFHTSFLDMNPHDTR
jgi:hypothetical protein